MASSTEWSTDDGDDELDAGNAGNDWRTSPLELKLPKKFDEWRAGQVELLQRVLESDRRFIIVEAPTGAGKSLMAAAWQKLTKKRTLYMCTTKQLQDQVQHDFPYAKVLKGRANYPTRNYPNITCDQCQITMEDNHCPYCVVEKRDDGVWIHDCPYVGAKNALLKASFGVVNTALFMTEANFVGRLSGFEQVVLDEADGIEAQLMGFAELTVSKRVIGLLGLEPPQFLTKEETWGPWAAATVQHIDRIKRSLTKYTQAEQKSIENVYRKVGYFLGTLREGNVHWVNCTTKQEHAQGPWTWKPVKVDTQAHKLLWDHGKRWLLLSATVLSPEQFCRDLGIDRSDADFIRLPSTFPIENRPVHYYPVAEMKYDNREEAVPVVVAAIDAILARHPEEKIVIHAVSYWLLDQIIERSVHKRRLMYFKSAMGREKVIQRFRRAGNDAVLVAPGLERGLDLPYDQCRVVVIPKLPYPSLADKQVNARLHAYRDGNDWYTLQTARALVQASGRGVRADDDTCTIYLLDRQFSQFVRRARRFLPSWWYDAVQSHSAAELV